MLRTAAAVAALIGCASAGTVAVSVTNACDSSCKTHDVKITAPSSAPSPGSFSFSGTGVLDTAVDSSATMTLVLKLGGVQVLNKVVSACGDQSIALPVNLGSVDVKGVACPAASGSTMAMSATVTADVALPAAVTATATYKQGDDELVVLDIQVKPQAVVEGRVVMEPEVTVGAAPSWVRGERCGADESVDALFMMKMSAGQAAELEQTFWAVSDPKNPRYGQHLSREQLREVVKASPAAAAAVHDLLKSVGVTGVTAATGDSIRASIPCAAAEEVFGTHFYAFRHSRHNARVLRAVSHYSLPAAVAEHVQIVANLVALPKIEGPMVVAADPTAQAFPAGVDCGGKCGAAFTTPGVLAKAYNLGDAPSGPTKGSMAVAEFQGVYYDDKDLEKWGAACGVNATVDIQVGKNSPTKCSIPIVGTELCGEALLDIEYIKAVGGSIPLTDIFSSKYSLLNWMTSVLDMSDVPLIHSVSYGNDEVQQTGVAFMDSCNAQFMKAGARGVSVLFASGDQGVLGRSGAGSRYHPDFPAGSPYITAVGGTDFAQKSVIGAEKAWTQGGGGFSDTFGTPSYQASAVKAYFSAAGSDLPAASKWNNTGRGYPDVSALGGQGNAYCIHAGGMFAGVAGTSAACPVVAGVFAKLNEVRLAKGAKPLGFLNPLIYQLAGKGFNDVTQGRNCGKTSCTGSDGFPAVKGWDAATGWGTPDFGTLKTLV